VLVSCVLNEGKTFANEKVNSTLSNLKRHVLVGSPVHDRLTVSASRRDWCALLNKRARQLRSMIQFPYCGTPITAVLSYNLCFNNVHSHCFAAVSTQSNNSLKVRSHRAACCRFRHNIFHNCLIFLKVITPLQKYEYDCLLTYLTGRSRQRRKLFYS